LVPLHFWLPATYANAPAPVAALFAIMTKVGAYAIIRIHTLVFGPENPATDTLIGDWLFPLALLTMAVGAFGVLGARRLGPLLSYSVVGSMGTLLLAVSVFDSYATTTALYYLIHSTFSAAALFLLADLVVSRRGNDWLGVQRATAQNGLFAALFFAAAIAMAGMPPLSGFLGKLLIMDALRAPDVIVWAWTAILLASLLTILGFARAGSALFWKSTAVAPQDASQTDTEASEPAPAPAGALDVAPTIAALALLVGLAAFAGPVTGYLESTSAQLHDSTGYVEAVLNGKSQETK
jgi:multicomponent K+:H+ antiporter subunit D